MSKKSNYVSTNRSKHYLKCHLIFVCKYRKKLLVGDLDNDIKSIMQSITSKADFEIEVFESDIDLKYFTTFY
jgi:putative transposase